MRRKSLLSCFSALLIVLVPLCVLAGGYGAIAYSESEDVTGYSYGYNSAQQAINSAEARCGKPNCAWKTWFRNACGALAKGSNGILGWDGGLVGRQRAEEAALAACRRHGGEDCKIICWACSHQ